MTSAQRSTRTLSVHETGFVDLNSRETPQIISGICLLDGPVQLSLLTDRLEKFAASHPLYSCHLSTGIRSEWVPAEKFQLENQIAEIDFTSGSLDAFVNYVAAQAAVGFLPGQPPWKVWLTNAKHNDGTQKSAVAFSAHHALVDGLEAFELFAALSDQSRKQTDGSARQVSPCSTIVKPSRISWNCIKAVSRDLTLHRIDSPISGTNSSKRQTFEMIWSRSDFAAARKTHAASLQELLLTVLAFGFRKYCESRGVAKPLRAILPLGKSVAASEAGVTNRHDPGLILLPLDCESLTDCILKIRSQLDALRNQQKQSVFETMNAFFEHLPRTIRTRAALRWTGLSNLLISVIPGPTRLPAIGGSTIESIFALPALAPGHGLTVGIVCLRNTICLAGHFDPGILTSPEELKADLETAYRELLESPGS